MFRPWCGWAEKWELPKTGFGKRDARLMEITCKSVFIRWELHATVFSFSGQDPISRVSPRRGVHARGPRPCASTRAELAAPAWSPGTFPAPRRGEGTNPSTSKHVQNNEINCFVGGRESPLRWTQHSSQLLRCAMNKLIDKWQKYTINSSRLLLTRHHQLAHAHKVC